MADLQLYDPLDEATEAALRASIRRFGVIVPVVVDQKARIIDGHHRSRIARELGLSCPQTVRRVKDEDEAQALARTLNEDRRQLLDVAERRKLVVDLAEEVDDEGVGIHTPESMARALGVSRPTVLNDIDTTCNPDKLPSHRRGLDGKVRPSTRPTPDTPAQVTPIVRSRRPDPVDEVVKASPTESLRIAFLDIYERFAGAMQELMELSPQNVYAALDGSVQEGLWKDIDDTRSGDLLRAQDWFDALVKAKPKPFDVVQGGRG